MPTGAAVDCRALTALDLGAAAELHAEAFAARGERGWSRREFAELLATPGVRGLLAEAAGTTVGLALYRRVADEAELLTLAVHPGHRRRGIARGLLASVVAVAGGGGARRLFLEVGDDNPSARALYAAAGFATVATRRAYYQRPGREPGDALVMRLDLA